MLHYIAAKRLAAGRLTVVDATNVQREARQPLVRLAREHHVLPVAVVFNLPEEVCRERNADRADREFGPPRDPPAAVAVAAFPQSTQAGGVPAYLRAEVPGRGRRRDDRAGSLYGTTSGMSTGRLISSAIVHGCCDELEELLAELGYERCEVEVAASGWTNLNYTHPEGRKAVFVGDLVDRGPRIIDTLSLVRNMVAAGAAMCVPGNHDMKLLRKLRGKNVQITHGLAESLAEIEGIPEEEREAFSKELAAFLDSLVSHYVLDDGKDRGCARGDERIDAGPRIGEGARIRPLRRNDGRNGRVRPAGPLRLGIRIPRRRDGRLRSHAGPGAGLAQ